MAKSKNTTGGMGGFIGSMKNMMSPPTVKAPKVKLKGTKVKAPRIKKGRTGQ